MSSFENVQPEEAITTGKSRDGLYIFSLVLIAIGLFISGYLSYVKLTDVPMVCVAGSVFNCEVVQNSIYSRLFGLPIAWLGFAVYIILAVLLLTQNRSAFMREYGVMIQFGIILFAWLFSMWLVYVQFFRLQALCPWCLSHETNFTILFIVSIFRLKRRLTAPA
jgi:uncharacterized membrane protein